MILGTATLVFMLALLLMLAWIFRQFDRRESEIVYRGTPMDRPPIVVTPPEDDPVVCRDCRNCVDPWACMFFRGKGPYCPTCYPKRVSAWQATREDLDPTIVQLDPR